MPTDAAGELSGEGFAQAEGYEQIQARIAAGIPGPSEARPNAGADADADVDADADADADDAVSGSNANGAEAGDTASRKIAGLSASSLEVSGKDGYSYRAAGEYLQVVDAATGARAQEVNLYDCTGQGGQALCVALSGDTLAVLFQTSEGVYRQSDDYALAAYAAPRSLVLFFDAAEPARIVFDRVLGVTGVPVAVVLEDDVMVVSARHKVVPDVDDGGDWLLDGKSADDVRSYRAALELRAADPYAFVPSFFDDGELTALAPEQIYLSGWGSATVATTVASFVLSEHSGASLFALYDPGVARGSEGTGVRLQAGGLVFDYVADYQGAPAAVSVTVPLGADGTLTGIGQVSWSEL
jgi:hypothetical protein